MPVQRKRRSVADNRIESERAAIVTIAALFNRYAVHILFYSENWSLQIQLKVAMIQADIMKIVISQRRDTNEGISYDQAGILISR